MSGNSLGLRNAYKSTRDVVLKISIGELILIWVAFHLFLISSPQTPVFDETYYTKAATDLINRIPSNPEHPFLGKLWGAIGILIFGNNYFGWRIPIIVFGALTLYAFYRLSAKYLSERQSLLATAFLGFDLMFFTHSGLLLLETPALFFGILAMFFYLEKRYGWAAIAMGLSILSKETSLFLLLSLIIFHISRRSVVSRASFFKGARFIILLAVVVAALMQVYDTLYVPVASESLVKVVNPVVVVAPNGTVITETTSTSTMVSKNIISNPVLHWSYIVTYASSLSITDRSAVGPENYPWNWIIPVSQPPMLYYRSEVTRNITTYENGNAVRSRLETVYPITWRGISSLPLWYTIWVVLAISIYKIAKKKLEEGLSLSISWIVGTYLPLILISTVFNRVEYPFYYINTLPALALGFTLAVNTLNIASSYKWLILSLFGVLSGLFFLYYFPVNIWAQG